MRSPFVSYKDIIFTISLLKEPKYLSKNVVPNNVVAIQSVVSIHLLLGYNLSIFSTKGAERLVQNCGSKINVVDIQNVVQNKSRNYSKCGLHPFQIKG